MRIGEGAPSPLYSEESVETVKSVLNRYLIPVILGMNTCLLESKKIASLSESSGVPCCRGSMASLGIYDAAEVHLVASAPNIIYPEVPGANRSEEVVDTVIKERLKPEYEMIKVPHSPGLGVELDEKKLARYKIDI